MNEDTTPPENENDSVQEGESLDAPVNGSAEQEITTETAEQQQAKKPKKFTALVAWFVSRLNVYLLGFIFIVVVSIVIVFILLNSSNEQQAARENIAVEELTQEAIENLTSNESFVGDPNQLLSVESNAVFAGKVLIRDGLDVAGPIKVGGDLNLPGITVSGQSAFDEVQINTLSISGDANIQGVLSVENNLTVGGQATFGGSVSAPSITTDQLQLTGDIQFGRHIDSGGPTPSVTSGNAVGGGGTVTINGTDTGGTVTVNVGSGAGSGILATVSFRNTFTERPHVVITPVADPGSGPISSGGLFFITNRTSDGFSISTTTGLSAGSISFDYIAIN